MKKSFYFVFVILVIAGVGFFACNSNEPLDRQEPIEVYDNPMKFAGELHNQGLTLIMNEVNSMPQTRVHEFDLLSSIDKFVAESFGDLPEEDLKIVRDELPGIMDNIRLTTRSNINKNLSNNLQPYIDQLFELMSDDDVQLESLHARIVKIEKDASEDKKISEVELYQFFACSAVAYYSLEYWQNDFENIGKTRGEGGPFSWKELGKADVGGAFMGATAVGAEYLIAGGPIGWKIIAAAVVGGAVGGSAWNAIDQLW